MLRVHTSLILLLSLSACHSTSEKPHTEATQTNTAQIASPSPQEKSDSSPSPSITPETPRSTPLMQQGKQSKVNRKPASSYRTNTACIDLIKSFEGVRYEAYVGPAGHWLIGYGHKAGVKPGMKINEQQAEDYLKHDLQSIEQQVAKMIHVDVTKNEFSALVCLGYNIGWGNLLKSTVVRQVNAQNWQQAADAFLMWRKANGKVSTHLEKRRALERDIFLTP